MQAFSLIAVVSPRDSVNWIRLARTMLQGRDLTWLSLESGRTRLVESAAPSPHIAYHRTTIPGEEADALAIPRPTYAERRIWRLALDTLRLSLEARDASDLRVFYDGLREQYGFRLLDYSVDADAASPRACFQFSEDLPGKQTDLAPFVVVAGQDKP